MSATADQLWDALERLANEDGTADKIQPGVIAMLVEFKMVEIGAPGLPRLTPCGDRCYLILESGDGEITEIDELAENEDRQRLVE